jgi:glucosamine-6-phosphate deaminase
MLAEARWRCYSSIQRRTPAIGETTTFPGDSALRVIIKPDRAAASRCAAEFVARILRRKPRCVLGLATGSTPQGLYGELIRMHHEEDLDFSQVVTFNLDEYVGLGHDHPQSYRYFMQQTLFDEINILPQNTHVPDGLADDYDVYCEQYEQQIRDVGGVDLQILGIGTDGHIAFNEPGSSLGSRTRLKSLAGETIRDNARFFGSQERVPRLAITVGVGTILESRRCLLMAFGRSKAKAIRDTIEGPVTAQVTASSLQLHREVVVVLDEAAASELERREYYEEVEESQHLLESGQGASLGLQPGSRSTKG